VNARHLPKNLVAGDNMIGFVQILGGLALLLYGIRLLSTGMEKLAGEQIQKWLDRVTSNRLKSAGFGAAATALIHSSGLLMVTMIGLINANLMNVEQAIGVMLGQEIGTTLTAQIVAFDIGKLNLLFIVLGIAFLEFFENREWKKYGEICMGIGLVFTAMGFMSAALTSLMGIQWVADGMVAMGQYPMIGALAGLILTSLTQSSTAVTSMTVAMGMSHAITIEGAVGIILGANIGSCVTGFIASIRLSSTARQASMAQILINVFGVILFLPFISQFANLITHTSSDLPRQIANAHTIFNIAVSAVLFPFVKQIAWVSRRLAPEKPEDKRPRLTAYIDDMQLNVPAVALKEAARELVRLGEATVKMFDEACLSLIRQDATLARQVLDKEDEFVDPIFKVLTHFVNTLLQNDLTTNQLNRCFQLKNLLIDIERVGDISEDIAQFTLERVKNQALFSSKAMQDLESLHQHVLQTYALSVQAFRDSDHDLAHKVCRREHEFDHLYSDTRQKHIERLETGICAPEANVIFTEMLRSLERVSDHADNLGVSVQRNLV
jgi:phosphate:Na+ symporter